VPHLLETFGPDDVRNCVETLRRLPAAGSPESDAQQVCEALRRELLDADAKPACALVRIYKTERYDRLDPDVQDFARRLLDGEPRPDLRCLTLLGTAGDLPEWNDRRSSAGHRAIPLPTPEFVERLPMVAQLVTQLGLELGTVVEPPPPHVARELAGRNNDVFHVAEAVGSPYLPAQDFVREHGVRSAVGFGGILLTGDFFAAVLFAKVPVSDTVARTLKILTHPLRLRFLALAAGIGTR
jgi:hypothetical protein